MKLCDTSVLVDIDRGGVDERVRKLDSEGRHAIGIVTVTELRLGIAQQHETGTDRYREAVEKLERLFSRFEVFDVDRSVAFAAADIISTFRERGVPRNDLHDVYVAATARSRQLPVLTANVDHFDRIDGVSVIDWAEF